LAISLGAVAAGVRNREEKWQQAETPSAPTARDPVLTGFANGVSDHFWGMIAVLHRMIGLFIGPNSTPTQNVKKEALAKDPLFDPGFDFGSLRKDAP
jgi:hypothetical protein